MPRNPQGIPVVHGREEVKPEQEARFRARLDLRRFSHKVDDALFLDCPVHGKRMPRDPYVNDQCFYCAEELVNPFRPVPGPAGLALVVPQSSVEEQPRWVEDA